MSRRFLSYDPTKELLVSTVLEDGKNRIIYEQDVQPYLDEAARWRNELHADHDKGEDLRHVAFVPDSVILKMRFEDGVDFYDRAQYKEVLRLLQTKYPACKTTTKRLA
jgi:hypothetical protein